MPLHNCFLIRSYNTFWQNITVQIQPQLYLLFNLSTISACDDAEKAKSNEYSSEMQNKMGGFLTYRHEDGMNFVHVLDDIIVGSCLQTPEDLDRYSSNLF